MRSIQAARRGRPSSDRCSTSTWWKLSSSGDSRQRGVAQERDTPGSRRRRTRPAGSRRRRACPRTRPARRPCRADWRANVSSSTVPASMASAIAFGGPFQTSSNHSMNISSPRAGAGSLGNRARVGPGRLEVAEDAPRVRHHRAVVVQSTGTRPGRRARSPCCGRSSRSPPTRPRSPPCARGRAPRARRWWTWGADELGHRGRLSHLRPAGHKRRLVILRRLGGRFILRSVTLAARWSRARDGRCRGASARRSRRRWPRRAGRSA